MNKANKSSFDRIKGAAASYQGSVKEALFRFRNADAAAKEESKKFKDEDGIYQAKRAALISNAQNAIKTAEAAFTGNVAAEGKGLQKELDAHLTTRPTSAFLETARIFRDFNLTPSEADIKGLIALNAGTEIGLRVINSVLEGTGSGYRVTFPDGSSYEKDLVSLDRLTRGNFGWTPTEYHAEACAVFGGKQITYYAADGRPYTNGTTYNSVSLITARSAFDRALESLDGMASRWTDAVIPSIEQVKDYTDTTDPKTGKTVDAAEQYIADREATADAATIEKADASAARGREIGAERAATDAKAAATVAHYVRG